MKYCSCANNKKFMIIINNIVLCEGIRKDTQYPLGKDFVHFTYCPWCGKEMKKDEIK